jgi:hypothetical protein
VAEATGVGVRPAWGVRVGPGGWVGSSGWGSGSGVTPPQPGQEDGDEQRQGRNKILVNGAVDGQGEISFLGYRLFAYQQFVNAKPLYQTLIHPESLRGATRTELAVELISILDRDSFTLAPSLDEE